VRQATVIKVDPERFDAAVLEPAVQALRSGGIVGMPTETVYGLAVNLDRPEAVKKLLELRKSPADHRITVHLGEQDELRKVVPGSIPASAHRLMRKFWPGPLTIVFPGPDPQGVGVRFPNHKVATSLALQAGVRLGAASAHRSGEAAAVSGEEVLEAFGGDLDVVIDAGTTRHRGPSSVVRLQGTRIEVLREGAIPREMIEETNVVTLLFICTGNTCRSPMAEAMTRQLLAERLDVPESDLETHGYRVLSAGTAAVRGGAATEEAEEVVKKYGADLSHHSSRPVTAGMVDEADRVFVMTPRHRQILTEWMPEQADKVELLDPEGATIEDPVGGSLEIYRNVARHIHTSLVARLREI
jgi:protein-tyrosine phosphatase